jgi:hypothetical protein
MDAKHKTDVLGRAVGNSPLAQLLKKRFKEAEKVRIKTEKAAKKAKNSSAKKIKPAAKKIKLKPAKKATPKKKSAKRK